MPVYEYSCPRCRIEFELMRPLSEATQPGFCPQCGQQGERLMSIFASKANFYLKVPEKGAFRKSPEEASPKGKRKRSQGKSKGGARNP